MEIRSTEEVLKTSYEFADAILEKQLEIKSIQAEIKDIKDEYKEQGVAVNVITKALNKIKARMRMSDGDILEEEIILEKLEANDKVRDNLQALIG